MNSRLESRADAFVTSTNPADTAGTPRLRQSPPILPGLLLGLSILFFPAAVIADAGPTVAAPPPAVAPASPPAPGSGAIAPADYVPDEVLVAFRGEPSDVDRARSEVAALVAAEVVKVQPVLGYTKLRLPAGASVEAAVRVLSADPRVEWAEPNYYFWPSICLDGPQDPMLRSGQSLTGDQWGVFKTGAHSLWRNGGGGSGTIEIAIVDTGIDNFPAPHPDLAPNVIGGYDFVGDDADPTDEGTDPGRGHGTEVAGIAAAATNAIGIAGLGYCSPLRIVRVLDCADSCRGTSSRIADGIQYAADEGSRVINLSLGGPASNAIRRAVHRALARRAIVVAASGNDGAPIVSFPARIPEVIAVGASTPVDEVWIDSNFGTDLDVVAPGVEIWSTSPGPGYSLSVGTSYAAPFVSGIVALLVSRNNELNAFEAEAYLKSHTVDLPGIRDGSGRVDFNQLEDWSDAPPPFPGVRHENYLWEWLGEDATAEQSLLDLEDADGRPNVFITGDVDGGDDGVFPLSALLLPYQPAHIDADPDSLHIESAVSRATGPRYGPAPATSLHLDSWFDWDSDQTFLNTAVEHEVTDHVENPAAWGANSKIVRLPITPPDEHILGNPLVVRTRIAYGASAGAPDADPIATGEVEDDVMINFVEDFDIDLHTVGPPVYMTFINDGWDVLPDPSGPCLHHGQWHYATSHHPGGAASIPCNEAIEQVNVMSTPVMDWSEYTEAHLTFWFCHMLNACPSLAGDHCRVEIDTAGVKTVIFPLPDATGFSGDIDLSGFVGCSAVRIDFIEDTDWTGAIAIDDVVVWAFDDDLPQSVVDLNVSRTAGSNVLALDWTAPDENLSSGPPADPLANIYQIRYSTGDILNLQDWMRATPFTPKDVIAGPFPVPAWPGMPQAVSLRVPSAFGNYCVALRAGDEVVSTADTNEDCDNTLPLLAVAVLGLGDASVAPGDTAIVFFDVENTGNVRDGYTLAAQGSRPWTLAYDPDFVALDPSEEALITAVVIVPATAVPGQVDSVTLVATSINDPDVTGTGVNLVEVSGNCHYSDHEAGNVRLTVTDQGAIGYLASGEPPGSGFVFPQAGGANRLYIAGFMAGTGAGYMLNRDYALDPAREWEPLGCLAGTPGPCADESWAGSFADGGHATPRGLTVTQTSYAWAGPPDDDYVILSYRLANGGTDALAGLRSGVFADWDLEVDGGFDQNRGGVDPGRDLAYMWREGGGDGTYVGIEMLAPATAATLTLVNNPTYVYPLNYLSDADRFHFLAGDPGYVVHTTPGADDWSVVVGAAPVTLAPGDTTRVAFALVAGTTLADLLANADAAAVRWATLCGTTALEESQPAAGAPAEVALFVRGENPLTGGAELEFSLPRADAIKIAIYDANGRFVARAVDAAFGPGFHRARWDGRTGSGIPAQSGVYFARLETAAGASSTQKLVMMR